MAATQVENFLTKAEAVVPPETAAEQAQPQVPFQSALKLTAAQEKRMIEHAFQRYRTLQGELGRDQTLQPQWWLNSTGMNAAALASQGLLPSDTFLGKRSRFDATFANDVSWRPFTFGADSIFASSNFAVPVVRRVCRQMIARAKNAFFKNDPWFSVGPAPVPEYDEVNDAERAEKIQDFTRFKLKETKSKSYLGRAIKQALILGEVVVKTSYVVRDQIFNVEARVLTDVDGNAVPGADGNMITEGEEFVDAEDGTGRRVLARDKETEEPLGPIYEQRSLDRRQVLFEGARSEPIYYKDFLCPLTATDLQTADTCIHLYDRPVMEFVDLVVKRGMVDNSDEGRKMAAQKMVALIKKLSDNSPAPKAAVTQDVRPGDNYQAAPSVETGGPVAEFAEFYLWFDANEDGIAENICLIADRNSQAPIFYDHVANISTDGLRPLEVVRINPVEGRWYGLGIMELFSSYQDSLDLLINRWNFSQSRAGRVDFWKPSDTLEGDREPNLKLNWGGTYTAKPNADVEKILKPIYLNDIKFEQIHLMAQFFQQLLTNEAGVLSANDGQSAGLASSDLATGVLEVQAAGSELFDPIIADLKEPLEAILNREIDVTLANINPVEAYEFFEGNTAGIDTLTPDDVRGLKYKCVIALGAEKDAKTIQMSAQAAALVEKFYTLLPEVQMRVVSFYRQQLRILAPSADPDVVIQPLPPTLQVMDGGAPNGQQPEKKDSATSGGGAVAATQLGQKTSQSKGVSAPGGTPKSA